MLATGRKCNFVCLKMLKLHDTAAKISDPQALASGRSGRQSRSEHTSSIHPCFLYTDAKRSHDHSLDFGATYFTCPRAPQKAFGSVICLYIWSLRQCEESTARLPSRRSLSLTSSFVSPTGVHSKTFLGFQVSTSTVGNENTISSIERSLTYANAKL